MYCRKCGGELKDNAKFCNRCGAPVNNEEPEGSRGLKYLAIILACVAVAAAVIAVVLLVKSRSEEGKNPSAAVSSESTTQSKAESTVSDTDETDLNSEGERDPEPYKPFIDTDREGLSDSDETDIYHTNPEDPDTDGDGVDDRTEIWIGTDPNHADTEFTTTQQDGEINEIVPVSIEVAAITDAEGAGTLSIDQLTNPMQPALMACAYGYIAPAYEISCEGELESAVLTFSYDTDLESEYEDFDPTIYRYDEENDEYIEVEGQTKENGTVRAVVTHFSTYMLLDKNIIDKLIDILPDFIDESEFLPDENNDKIPDIYAEYINEGKVLYSNTGMLIGALDIFGDSDDWDDDGLKNGEEIGFKIYMGGKLKIVVHSNPYSKDTDRDGLDDYEEVKLLKSSPLLYDRSGKGAYDHLYSHTDYQYATHKEDWSDGLAKTFDWDKQKKAKACLINFFYDYAPEDSINKNAEEIARLTEFNEFMKCVGAVGDLIGAVKDLHSMANSIDEARFYGTDAEEKARLLCGNQKALISVSNTNRVQLLNTSQKYLKSVSEIGNDIQKTVEDDGFKKLEAVTSVATLASRSYSLYAKCMKNHVFSLRSEMETFTRYAKNPSAPGKLKGGTALTVVCDIWDGIEEFGEILETYSKLKVNADVYNMYLELLTSIRVNSEYEYISSAAGEIEKIVQDKGMEEFYDQLSDACLANDIATAVNIGLDVLAKTNPYAAAAKVLIDAYKSSGLADQAKYDVYFETMMEVSDGCRRILNPLVKTTSQTFSYSDSDAANVEKYLIQLAQSRIIGEYFFYQYCAENNIANWISSMLSGKQPQYYMDLFKEKAGRIYGYTNRLHLVLSKNLPHYDLYYDDSVPDDHIKIPLDAERLFHNAAGKYTLIGYKESWKTEFVLYENGYFSGTYKAVKYIDPSTDEEGVEKVYSERTFSGRFSVGDPIEDYAFKLVLEEFDYEGIEDHSFVEEIDGEKVRHICAPAPGLEDVTDYILYGPDTPPEEVRFAYSLNDYFIGTGNNSETLYYFSREPIDFSILGSYHFLKAERSGATSITDDSFVKEEDRGEDSENKIEITIENAQLSITKDEKFLYTMDMDEENPKFRKNYIVNRHYVNGGYQYANEGDYPLTLPLNRTSGSGDIEVYFIGEDETFMDTVRFEGDYMILSVYTFESYNVFWFVKDRL